jgi:gamma-glutamyl-gamma-aminobutyraldehyde dehydrogenase
MEDVIASANKAQKIWNAKSALDRSHVLHEVANKISEMGPLFAEALTREMGKPYKESMDEVHWSVHNIRYYAEMGRGETGKVIVSAVEGQFHYTLKQPLGTCVLILPFNYPMVLLACEASAALAAGNSVVLKPAEQSPHSCLKMAELFVEAGGPPGVFNVVNGYGEVAGKALALHPDVSKISFTGSTEVGKLILQYAGQSNMKKVGLECGGKTPQIFFEDLPDMKRAVEAAYEGIYCNMGEMCNAGSRIFVEQSIYGDFLDQFVADGKDAYVPGDPLDPETNMGPLPSATN